MVKVSKDGGMNKKSKRREICRMLRPICLEPHTLVTIIMRKGQTDQQLLLSLVPGSLFNQYKGRNGHKKYEHSNTSLIH